MHIYQLILAEFAQWQDPAEWAASCRVVDAAGADGQRAPGEARRQGLMLDGAAAHSPLDRRAADAANATGRM
jgi:hypothetical protein